MDRAQPDSRRPGLERRLLGLLLALLGLYYAWLLLSRRIPRNHDSFYVYILEQLFQTQAAQDGSLLLWFPYSTHGVVSSWYVAANSFFHDSVLLLGGAADLINPVPLFTLGMLFEDLLLLLGAWSLAPRFIRSPYARFFVTASVVGSSFWAQQMWHNHRPAYAVPMILALFLGFFEDGRRIRLFLALNLLFLQFLGNLAYVAVMTHLVVGLYLVVYVALYRRSLRLRWPLLRPRPSDMAILLVNLAVLACVSCTLTSGTHDITLSVVGRNSDGTVPLSQFLAYPGELDPVRYGDLLLGVSPSMDYTLYCGAAVVPFAILALALRPGRQVLYLSVCVTLLFLLSLGFLSSLGMPAYLLPPLRYFRYFALTSVHLRLPLILLAGIGVDALLRLRGGAPSCVRRTALALTTLGLLCGLLALLEIRTPGEAPNLVRYLQTPNARLAGAEIPAPQLAGTLAWTGGFALAMGGVLFLRIRHAGRPVAVVALLLIVHTADVARWRVWMTRDRTVSLSDAQMVQQRADPLPFVRRRSAESGDPQRLTAFPLKIFDDGASYDTMENFYRRDPPASNFITSHWMGSLDQLLRAYAASTGASASSATPLQWRSSAGATLRPPFDKIIGQSRDKLQVFSSAHVLGSDRETAELLNDQRYSGDALLLAPPPSGPDRIAGAAPDPRTNERLQADVEVLSFDANHLRARVPLETGRPGAWLLYCDAWHADWTATVNGRAVPVSRAFLAYKAVPLGAGENVVEFRMRSPSRVWTFRIAAANAAAWVLGILGFAGASLFSRRARSAPGVSGGVGSP